jgi:hypothetical protein
VRAAVAAGLAFKTTNTGQEFAMARPLIFWLLIIIGFLSPISPARADRDDMAELQGKLGNEWVEVRYDRKRSIRTWIKQEDQKRYRSFKVEATLEGSMEAYARIMLDFDSYHKWYWEVLESRLLKKVSATEYYLYFRHRTPHGIPGRDAVLHAVIEPQTRSHNFIVMTVKAEPGFVPEKSGLVRMAAEDMTVRFTPLPGNRVKVEAEGYVDPGGNIPAWANNYVQRAAPYSIMVGMQRMLENDDYSNSRSPLPFPILGAGDISSR